MKKVTKPCITKENLDVAHSNTILSQLLQLIPRHVFAACGRKHITGRKPRTFDIKAQFIALAFMQLTARRSLRDSVRCLESLGSKLYHLGMKPVSRSTFSDANNKRSADIFKDIFSEMYARCVPHAPKHKFRFKSKLISIDSTTIKLCLSLFPWAAFRNNRGGVKMHTMLDHNGHIPAFINLTAAKESDISAAKNMDFPKGSILVFDRGYNDYNWFLKVGENGCFFVTRLKKNAKYRIVERRKVNKKQGVTSDQVIEIKTKSGVLRLRRIGYRDKESGKHYEFLTNHFRLVAKTIADIYKERWKIETFFKEIKQNLKIKSFVGTSENAVLAQVYVALTVYLLTAYYKFLSRVNFTVQQMLQVLQVNVFSRSTLQELFRPDKAKPDKVHDLRLLDLANS
jgi:hypothetical protein